MLLSHFVRSLLKRISRKSKPVRCAFRRPILEFLEDRVEPATFTVLNPLDAGAGSLRQAILNANATPGSDTINFNIPGAGFHTINLNLGLPTITERVTIAGNSQPGFAGLPLVGLNGAAAGVGSNGLVLKGTGSVLRSLAVDNFHGNGVLALGSGSVVEGCYLRSNDYYGVLVTGAATGVRIGSTVFGLGNVISANGLSGVAIQGTLTNGNLVQGNLIGTNLAGNAGLPNLFDGVLISGGAKNNTIGGSVAGAGNVISANLSDGIEINGAGTTGNLVQGNYIGISFGGNAPLGNSENGIAIRAGAANNTVGGLVAGARNVISANGSHGLEISGVGSSGNLIQGNYVGINKDGNADLGNGNFGVVIAVGATNNTVGGTVTGARNVVSGNAKGVVITGAGSAGNLIQGNFIGTNALGTGSLGNDSAGVSIAAGAANNMVGGTVTGARNLISGNFFLGVGISGAGTTGNKIQGNFIGTDANGAVALANASDGISISGGATKNTVGGTAAGVRNIISGNTGNGIEISGSSTSGNLVAGNYIGTKAAGTGDLGNAKDGVLIDLSSTSNKVGGTIAAARNVISGNSANGVEVSGAGTDNNTITGNFIGTNAAGTADLGNSFNGVAILAGATKTTVGGSGPGPRNIISGNDAEGVLLSGVGTGVNYVNGNFIGLNAAGTGDLGNSVDGIAVQFGASHNSVGLALTPTGYIPAGNFISGNNRFGVIVWDDSTDNFVMKNAIGLGFDLNTPISNSSHGVFVTKNAFENIIGGNRIAHNGGDGVLVGSDPGAGFLVPAGTGNIISDNSIYGNVGLGIDLGPNDGPTPNDVNDPDPGPNHLMNFPVLTSAYLSGTSLVVTGYINTIANQDYFIEFFANATGGQGQIQLGLQPVKVGSSSTGFFSFTLNVPVTVLKGYRVTATATDLATKDTSEFSVPVIIE